MAIQFTTSYLEDALGVFRNYKQMAEGAMAQISEQQLSQALDEESNSIALIVKHLSGNLCSRWTDFLVSDGEKPWRRRDSEFEDAPEGRTALLELWERGWAALFEALEPLTDEDLVRTVTIRGEPHSVMQATNRAMAHAAYHCGQIVFLAKHFRAGNWQSLSIPRGASEQFTRKLAAREVSNR